MYEELVKSLRVCGDALEKAAFAEYETCLYKQAADAIEELLRKKENADCYASGVQETLDHYGGEEGIVSVFKERDELLKSKPRWIPVEERLPDENGFYLCLYELKQKCGIRMEENLGILQFIDNKWSIFDIYVVTHWIPIPEPPKEET